MIYPALCQRLASIAVLEIVLRNLILVLCRSQGKGFVRLHDGFAACQGCHGTHLCDRESGEPCVCVCIRMYEFACARIRGFITALSLKDVIFQLGRDNKQKYGPYLRAI